MYVCRRCDEEIPPDVEPCPACGYDPGGSAKDLGGICLGLSVPLLYAVTPAGVFLVFVGLLCFGWGLLATPSERVL
ncbi:hypothetical protein [Halovivax gelatinilyticus]|uniref:hypothetical protein n=1 Tax=Halovivax gelatinilyticus TaxID=2961597 RepID=UPI0020CA7A91|nr:hypothetical protein [Halovivax gelatinilyticus]